MIEYAKTILPKITFSRELFRKELFKCIGWVDKKELSELQNWCMDNFGEIYPDILEEAFNGIAA
jgi:hypothetical protein